MAEQLYVVVLCGCTQIAKLIGPTWGHLGPVGPRWAPCWPHEPCYQGNYLSISYSLCWFGYSKLGRRAPGVLHVNDAPDKVYSTEYHLGYFIQYFCCMFTYAGYAFVLIMILWMHIVDVYKA